MKKTTTLAIYYFRQSLQKSCTIVICPDNSDDNDHDMSCDKMATNSKQIM